MTRNRNRRPRGATARNVLAAVAACVALIAVALAPPPVVASDGVRRDDDRGPVQDHPGYVDIEAFVRVAGGDDAIRTDIQIYDAALRIIGRLDNPVGQVARGLRGVRALILQIDSPDRRARALETLRKTEKDLRARGWERLAVVRDEDEEVNVLVREREEKIVGLVVMIVGKDSGEVVVTNIVGTIDLDALQQFGADTNIPGLDQIGGGTKR